MRKFPKGRMEAFSDGVIAIIITIMVLELRPPHEATLHGLLSQWPVFISYVLSFIYVGIYWNNHHHLLAVTKHVNGRILWANMHLLFWLSLIPFTTSWIGESHNEAVPAAAYGVVLLGAALAYYMLQSAILHEEDNREVLALALKSDIKGRISPVLYASGIAFAFYNSTVADVIYAIVALMWLIPDRRIERA